MATVPVNASRPLAVEDITFEFEPFLKKNEENLPEGLDAHYLRYIPFIEKPFSNLRGLPKALVELPISAVLYQKWGVIFSLFGLLMAINIPFFSLLIITANVNNILAVGIALTIFITLGILSVFIYLKMIYTTLNNLIDSRKAPWLVEKIRKPFSDEYQKPWSRSQFSLALLLSIIINLGLGIVSLRTETVALKPISLLFAVLSVPGLTIVLFLSIITFRYIFINTSVIYDKVLQTIIERVVGYSKGHESILSKKNYEVVGVLSDTPGLSVRSLGDVPLYGLGSGIFLVNAMFMILLSPLLIIFIQPSNTAGRLQMLIIVGIALSLIITFGVVLRPLIRILFVMSKFKNKALSELDPFLFDEITGVALRHDREITNESQVLFMLRNYIYNMKISPVNPIKLIQIGAMAILYAWKGSVAILKLIAILGGTG